MSEPLGFVGLGTMGSRLALRLIGAGHELVVHTRTRAHAAEAEVRGATFAETPAELGSRCRFIFGCLLDSAVVETVYLGPDGLFTNCAKGQVFVEHGTFFLGLAQQLAANASERGASFLDAPVTGGPDAAEAGTLVTMVGGDAAALAEVKPLLDAYSKAVVHVGGAGAGLGLKMVNQHLVASHVVAAAEAMALAERLGLPIDLSNEVLTSGLASSAILSRSMPRIATSDYLDSGMPLEGLIEVLRLVAEVSASVGGESRLLPVVREVFADAVQRDLGKSDLAGLIEVFRAPATLAEPIEGVTPVQGASVQ
jgi:3-hydroxyisobutyrate dehydrogenase-like beta-hydroxyacid dehydrogenase